MLAPDLRETLVTVAAAMRDAQDPWWVISSAAVALHGVGPVEVGDVDVVMSVSDARRVMDGLGIAPIEDGASSLFRSTLFGRWETPPLVVEFMAGFHVATSAGWTEVLPRTRVPIFIEGYAVYVPQRAEFAGMLRLFGLPKDLERVRLLTSETCVWIALSIPTIMGDDGTNDQARQEILPCKGRWREATEG